MTNLRIAVYLIIERAINDATSINDEEFEDELEAIADVVWSMLTEEQQSALRQRVGPDPNSINPINILEAVKGAMSNAGAMCNSNLLGM